MPEDNEKVEDFISLWRKKMENEINKPSVIGETLDRIKEVEKENEQLRNKISENIELISRTESIIKNTIDENERLKEQLKQAGVTSGVGENILQQQNIDLNNKIITLESKLVEKEVELRGRNNEITELKTKLEALSKTKEKPISQPDAGVTDALINDLKSDLSKKKNQIDDLEKKISELTVENEALNKQLIEKMKKLPIDYVVPVEQPKPTVIRPQSTKPSSQTLEILCQDLQTDLNKYKKMVDKLSQEKSELEKAFESGGFQLEPDELKELKKENEELKNELSQIQLSLQEKSKDDSLAPKISELEKQIYDFQEQLIVKDNLITDLKSKQQVELTAHEGPMSSLIEDLQNSINKLKIQVEEKNKIIEELKSS
ncbi:MAG: hypothetical protein JSV62_15125 [Promethearchaeota archaeon]|nr:MAG: hypothetical protein JSV62_15125 [Candidatus Lokiarchaeota archaeon]